MIDRRHVLIVRRKSCPTSPWRRSIGKMPYQGEGGTRRPCGSPHSTGPRAAPSRHAATPGHRSRPRPGDIVAQPADPLGAAGQTPMSIPPSWCSMSSGLPARSVSRCAVTDRGRVRHPLPGRAPPSADAMRPSPRSGRRGQTRPSCYRPPPAGWAIASRTAEPDG